jgi:hypothetical protein
MAGSCAITPCGRGMCNGARVMSTPGLPGAAGFDRLSGGLARNTWLPLAGRAFCKMCGAGSTQAPVLLIMEARKEARPATSSCSLHVHSLPCQCCTASISDLWLRAHTGDLWPLTRQFLLTQKHATSPNGLPPPCVAHAPQVALALWPATPGLPQYFQLHKPPCATPAAPSCWGPQCRAQRCRSWQRGRPHVLQQQLQRGGAPASKSPSIG